MKYALGVFIDGVTLRTALVSKRSGHPVIEALETFTLFEPLERREVIEQNKKGLNTEDKQAKRQNPFGLDTLFKRTEDNTAVTDSSNNIDVILKMINQLCPRQTTIAFNLSDFFTFYKLLPDPGTESAARIKRIIWQSFHADPHAEAKNEHIGFVQLPDKSIFALYHDDPLVFSSLLLESFRLIRNHPPAIGLIDSLEFGLSHEIIHQYQLGDQDQTAVVLFSSTITKIYFMRGRTIHSVLPTIYEGAESENICETAFAKILFEFDSGKLSALNNIILAGDVDRVQGEKFFREKWPSAQVTRLEIVRAQLAEKLDVMHGRTCSYAMPIALALKSLDDKPKPAYAHNFVPRRILDKQSVYRLAWHSILLLVVLFCSVMFLTVQSVRSMQQVRDLHAEERMLQRQMEDLAKIAVEVDSLRCKIQVMEKGTALIDSLNKVSTRWSPLIESFSQAYESIGPFSFVTLTAADDHRITVEAELAQEKQVALLERMIPQSTLTSVVKGQDQKDRWIKAQFTCDVKGSN